MNFERPPGHAHSAVDAAPTTRASPGARCSHVHRVPGAFYGAFAAPENVGQRILGWYDEAMSDAEMLARLP